MTDNNEPTTNMEAQTAKDMYHRQVYRWKLLWVVTFSALALVLIGGTLAGIRIVELAKDTKHSVEILERATGPEAQEAQTRVIGQLVLDMDCSHRRVVQELIDQLPENQHGHISVMTPECEGAEH